MNYKISTFLTCTGGSAVAMMLTLATLEPYVDAGRMMAISLFTGTGSTLATLALTKRRYPPPAEAINSILQQGGVSMSQQFTLMEAAAILETRDLTH